MAFLINYAYISHTGRVRLNNEDNFWCCGNYLPSENTGTNEIRTGSRATASLPVMAVFDGMGGESCGEMASYLSALVCDKWYNTRRREMQRNPEEYLDGLCKDMNRTVCTYAEENKINSMGSTASLIVFTEQDAYICNLGDSPVFEICDGQMDQLSVDHVLNNTIFGKPPLTQFVGVPEEYMLIEPSISKVSLKSGTSYLVCSDGVTDMIAKEELTNLLTMEAPCEKIVEAIWKRAMEKGGRDNITLILCQVTEKENSFPAFFSRLSRFRKGQVTETNDQK